MSDTFCAERRRKLWCRKWISLVVRQCSYVPATEPVLQSIHYARSVISRSCAALRCYHRTLFNEDMDPREIFFVENYPVKILPGPNGEPLPWDTQRVRTSKKIDNQFLLEGTAICEKFSPVKFWQPQNLRSFVPNSNRTSNFGITCQKPTQEACARREVLFTIVYEPCWVK